MKSLSLSQKLLALEDWLAANPHPQKSAVHPSATDAREAALASLPILSNEDYDLFRLRWKIDRYGYAFCRFYRQGMGRIIIKAHQVIAHRMNLYPCSQIDHENGIRLDCQRHNLRASENRHNHRNLHKANYVGVHKCGNKWRARRQLTFGNLKISAGSRVYPTPQRAAFAYNQLAQLFGFETRNTVPIPAE